MGRTYVAATVDLPSLQLTAVQAAVAAAVSSGAQALEAVAVVGTLRSCGRLTGGARRCLGDEGPDRRR